jgi:hypothetical protein
MHLAFEHDPRGESRTLIRRADGAEFVLTSYSRKHVVPHDLVHAVVERELGIPDGIYGSIATWQASAEPLVFPWPKNLLASDGQPSVRRTRARGRSRA